MAISNRLAWIDGLRAIAIMGVVIIHVSGVILYKHSEVSTYIWNVGNFFDSLSRFAVPIFGMIMGATLLDKDIEIFKFYSKRFSRLLPPLIFWSIVFHGVGIFRVYLQSKIMSFDSVLEILANEFRNDFNNRFWYAYMLIGVYLLLPFLSKLLNLINVKLRLQLLVLWLILLVLRSMFPEVQFHFKNIQYFILFLGFPILGHYLKDLKIRNIAFPIFLISIGFLTCFLGTYYLSTAFQFNETLYDYLSFNTVAYSVGVFMLFKLLNWKLEGRVYQCTLKLNANSYGIYLVHLFVLWLLRQVGLNWSFIDPIIGIPLTTLVCVLFSSLLVDAVGYLPYGKFYSGKY